MNAPEAPAPKAPPAWANWNYHGSMRSPLGDDHHVWSRHRLRVISSVGRMDFRGEQRWQWLISVGLRGGQARPNDDELARALKDFGMGKAEEDNHEPGVSRKFFLLCDLPAGSAPQCECKETEETVVESDGVAWQKDPAVDTDEARVDAESWRRAVRLTGTVEELTDLTLAPIEDGITAEQLEAAGGAIKENFRRAFAGRSK
jgi:hypothetical protein